MTDGEKSREELISEITALRRRVEEFERESQVGDLNAGTAMKSSEDKYRIILENMDEAYFELDIAGYITFFNPAMIQMLGYSADELQHMNYRDYIPPEAQAKIYSIFNKIYRTGKADEIFDSEVVRKDGTRRIRELSASLIVDPERHPIGFRCLARDVTTRKMAEEALKKNEEELERKSTSLAESNAALKVLLKQREEDKVELERDVLSNVREIIMPYIEELNKGQLTANQSIYIDMIKSNLENVVSPFLRNITIKHFHLTPKEFQIANLVKEGRTTKEIAEFLNMSTGAIDFHRNNIRKKFGLKHKNINLRTYLLSLA